MGHIIALPYLLTGKPMLSVFLLIDWDKKLYIFSFLTLYLNINGCYKAIKVYKIITCIGFKPPKDIATTRPNGPSGPIRRKRPCLPVFWTKTVGFYGQT